MLHDVDSIKTMNQLNFGLEERTYTAVRRELRSYIFCRSQSYTVQKF